MSIWVIVGIVLAALIAVFLTVETMFEWKKYKKRTEEDEDDKKTDK